MGYGKMVNIPPPILVVNDEQRKQFCTKIKRTEITEIFYSNFLLIKA